MKRLTKLRWELILLNAVLIGLITFFSILISGGHNFDAVLPSAIFGGLIKALIELQGEVGIELKKVKTSTNSHVKYVIKRAKHKKRMKYKSISSSLLF